MRRERREARAAAARDGSRANGTAAGGLPPALPDALVEELTAQRTAALRVEVMRRPDLALASVVYALALPVFYGGAWEAESALVIEVGSVDLASRVADPDACPALRAMAEAREAWGRRLPGDAADLWGWLTDQARDMLLDLLAFLASRGIDAVVHRHEGRRPARIGHADRLAAAAALDMGAWWTADAAFLARLSKAGIAAAVAEGASPGLAAPLARLAKGEAVERAARALAGRGWLPEPLRTPSGNAAVSENDRAAAEVA